MSGLDEDLKKAKDGLVQLLTGVTQIEQATTTVVQKIEAVAGHLAEPGTLGRVAATGLGAALEAAGREVQAAAAQPPRATAPRPPPPSNVLQCRRHGEKPWQRTIVCTACGRVFQVLHAAAAHFAPEVCPCGVQLLPGLDVAYSAAPICTSCFTGIATSGGRAVRRTK
jgi:hypothetical protein